MEMCSMQIENKRGLRNKLGKKFSQQLVSKKNGLDYDSTTFSTMQIYAAITRQEVA